MKVLIGTAEISGIGANLRAGFEEIGVAAETVFSTPHPFRYARDRETPIIVRGWQRIGIYVATMRRKQSWALPLLSRLHQGYGLLVLLWALSRYDACIFLFGKPITNFRIEPLVWRWLGKKIIFVYVGSDTRPPYVSGALFPPSQPIDSMKMLHLTQQVKKRVAFQERYSDFCINSPFSAQFHSRPFINWFSLGIPCAVTPIDVRELPDVRRPVRIMHAPSRPEAKGSQLIRKIIANIQSKDIEIEYVEILNQPNSVVLAELKRCDFVVDQTYSDTPMAVFAAEAAALGKPAVVGGYAAGVLSTYVSRDDMPPSMFVHPDDLESAIHKMVVDAEFRQEMGRRAYDFIARRWSRDVVAGRYLRLLSGDVPNSWWYDPADIRYVHGAAIPEKHARRLVATMVENYGPSSLQISENEGLVKAFVRFGKSADE